MARNLFDLRIIFLALIMSLSLCHTVFGKEIDKSNLDKIDINAEISSVTVSELKKIISEYKDKVVIVNFWATWCPPCKDEIPGFIKLYSKYKDKGFEILGIALDMAGSRTVKPFAEKVGINYPLYIGGYDMNEEYEIAGIPTTLIFNKEGTLKVRHVGFAPVKEFEDEIINLLR